MVVDSPPSEYGVVYLLRTLSGLHRFREFYVIIVEDDINRYLFHGPQPDRPPLIYTLLLVENVSASRIRACGGDKICQNERI